MADPYGVLGYADYDILGEVLGDDDLMGDDELLLGDDFDILGARRRKKKKSGAARQVALARAAQRGALVNPVTPSTVRRLGLPLDSGSTLVAAGASTSIVVQPNVTIRPERLKIADECASAFRITSVAIGRRLQFAAGGSLSASLYRASNPNNEVQWDTADKREPIEFQVTNDSGASARFMGELVGTVVE